MRKSASLAILCSIALLVLPPTALSQVGVVQRVSTGLDGTSANNFSGVTAISADGCVVVFNSDASDLVLNDNNTFRDVFAFDACAGGILRVSLRNGGGEANGVSNDGSIVGASVRSGAFESEANNLVASDTNSIRDIFVVSGNVDNGMPTVERVSVPNLADQGMLGTQANADSDNPSMGGNEQLVAFDSDATNLVLNDTLGFNDVFVHDRQTGATTRVNLPNLADQGMLGTQANDDVSRPALSANGRFVAFATSASNLVLNDTNSASDIFVHDRQTGATNRVSVPNLADQGTLGTQAVGFSNTAAISADGRFVTFRSGASNLVLNDGNGFIDIFVHDRQTGATTRVSVPNLTDQGMLGAQANGGSDSSSFAISFRGRYVAFRSAADNLVLNDGNNVDDIFVHDRQTGETIRVSIAGATQGDATSEKPMISADGRFVAFDSNATNLAANDDNMNTDVFLAQTGVTAEALPVINNGGIVNAASFAPGSAVAPGSIAAVFGVNLSEGLGIAGATPLPTVLAEGGVTVDLNGTLVEFPMFFASPTQLNVQVPFEATIGFPNGWPVESGTSGNEGDIPVVQFAPGLFAANQAGTGQGAILIANSGFVAAPNGAFPGSRPAVRGVDFLEIYWTGGGPVTNQPATGAAASANPLSATTTTPTLTIGGVDTPVLFSGLAPGFVGLNVLTCLVPAGAQIGNAVQVVLTQSGLPSNTVTMAVAGP